MICPYIRHWRESDTTLQDMHQTEFHSDALEMLKWEFTKICLRDQECFQSEKGWETLLALMPLDRSA